MSNRTPLLFHVDQCIQANARIEPGYDLFLVKINSLVGNNFKREDVEIGFFVFGPEDLAYLETVAEAFNNLVDMAHDKLEQEGHDLVDLM